MARRVTVPRVRGAFVGQLGAGLGLWGWAPAADLDQSLLEVGQLVLVVVGWGGRCEPPGAGFGELDGGAGLAVASVSVVKSFGPTVFMNFGPGGTRDPGRR